MDQHRAIVPWRETRPNVGRSALVEQATEGDTIEPSVSVPMANATPPAAVADAEPAEDPLEPRVVSQGLRVRSPNHTSPHASAPTESFATSTAPAASRRSITSAVSSMICASKGFAPQVVRYPLQAIRSLTPHGIPWSSPRSVPSAKSASACAALSSARSRVNVMTQCSSSSRRWSRSRYISVSSTEVTSVLRRSEASSAMDQNAASSRSAGRATSGRAGIGMMRWSARATIPGIQGEKIIAGATPLDRVVERSSSNAAMRSRTSGIINSSSSGVKESPATRAASATSAASTRPSPWTGSAVVDAVRRRIAAIMGQSLSAPRPAGAQAGP